MNAIQSFCEERKITKRIENAFVTYCRSTYSQRFTMNENGETVKLVVDRMTDKQVLEAWLEFVNELKSVVMTP